MSKLQSEKIQPGCVLMLIKFVLDFHR